MDELINEYEQCETIKGADLIKTLIEGKRNELNYSVYLSGMLNPRD
jgi:hypothetical protein